MSTSLSPFLLRIAAPFANLKIQVKLSLLPIRRIGKHNFKFFGGSAIKVFRFFTGRILTNDKRQTTKDKVSCQSGRAANSEIAGRARLVADETCPAPPIERVEYWTRSARPN